MPEVINRPSASMRWRWSSVYIALVAAVGVSPIVTSNARADIPDPLHGFCNGSSPTGTCIDNGTNTPLGNSTEFGFYLSPGSSTGASGILTLDILLPNVDAQPASFSITGVNGYPSGTATEVSNTAWTSGDLATFLGIGASPNNGIGAFLPTTQQFASTATGYFVYQVTLTPDILLFNQANQILEFDAISGLSGNADAYGAYIVGFFNEGTATAPSCAGAPAGDECATANSGALLVNGTTPPRRVPEPASLTLFGTMLAGLGVLYGRRRRNAV